jgi:hypothetical protein
MSLPTFKFTKFGAPTNNDSVNSGLSVSSKMQKSGILSTIKEKAQDTFKDIKMPEISLETSDSARQQMSDDGESFFSIWALVKLVIIVVIVWFMWGSLSSNADFSLGMGEIGDKINSFFKSMEEKGRDVISRYTNIEVPPSSLDSKKYAEGDSDSDSDSDSDNDSIDYDDNSKNSKGGATRNYSKATYRPPVPPDATNSSDKKPGFLNDDSKYTFLDKAVRDYSGPSHECYTKTPNRKRWLLLYR